MLKKTSIEMKKKKESNKNKSRKESIKYEKEE